MPNIHYTFNKNPGKWLDGPVLFHPILDKYVIARTYEETLQKGLQNKVNILIGILKEIY
jgi:hypothetical protein